MNNKNDIKQNQKKELRESKRQFGKIVTISLLIGIIIISGFIIYYILNPGPGYYTLVVLNENKKMENYPTNATIGEPIYFYVGVENHLNRPFTFQIEILKGDNKTQLTSEGSINAIPYFNTTERTLQNSGKWVSQKLNISFSNPGNRTIIIELWETKLGKNVKFYNSLWIRLNITI
ncbi:MAG: DUF1616 domain-containing protein [Candidatus Lokiarchaeota archaeon]